MVNRFFNNHHTHKMKKSILILIVLLITDFAFSQKKPYVIYTSKGKKISYEKMIKSLVKKDIILFGEQHNNPISHWLQYEVTEDLNSSIQLILGAEMFEADNQKELNDYLKGSITYKKLGFFSKIMA